MSRCSVLERSCGGVIEIEELDHIISRFGSNAHNLPAEEGGAASNMVNINATYIAAEGCTLADDMEGKAAIIGISRRGESEGEGPLVGADERHHLVQTRSLIEKGAGSAYTIINIEIIVAGLGIERTREGNNRVGVGGIDDQDRVAVLAIVARRTAIVVDDTSAGIDGMGAGDRHIVGARSDLDGTFPETISITTVGAEIGMIATARSHRGDHIEGIDGGSYIEHAIDQGPYGVPAEFPSRGVGRRIPHERDAVWTGGSVAGKIKRTRAGDSNRT